MAAKGKEYKLAIRIAGVVDKSYDMSLVKASAELKKFDLSLQAIEKDFNSMDKAYNKIMKAGRKAFEVVEKAALGASIAVAGVTAASVKLGSDFEAEMSTVQSISGATTAELTKLSDKAREVARSTVFSATEVGQAMEYMGMAGWKTEQILSGLSGVVDLAAASGEDLGLVSDIVTDSLTAMGQTAADSGHFADVLAAAAMNSNTNVEQLGYAFKYAAPMAGSLGYNIEDLTVAMGTMASSGIKASVAGTTLRNIMTRMAKPTKESRDAMAALGLSLTDSEGNMLSLMDIMKQLRKAYGSTSNKEGLTGAITELAGLTDDQIEEIQSNLGELTATEEAFYAAELGGARGISGLLAIANTSEEEFNKLVDAIYNAEGAAEEMANVRLDNLQGDVTILRDTASDAAIELYYQFNDELRGAVQALTEDLSGLAKHIPTVFRKLTGEFATFKRKFISVAKPVFDAMLSTFKWMLKNGAGIANVIVDIGAALATYKVLSTIVHMVAAVEALGAAVPIVAGLVIGMGGAAGLLVKAHRELSEMASSNLAEHFGDLSLSMSELKTAAEGIVKTGTIKQLETALSEFENLEGIQQGIDDAVDTMNRMNWMVKVGVQLDEGDQNDYKQAIDNYIEGVQDYVTQGRYAATLSLAPLFNDNSTSRDAKMLAAIDNFYAANEGRLEALGRQLNLVTTKAFNDGLLEIQEAAVIQRVQTEMADIQKQLQLGEADATLAVLSSKYAGNLTPDTFKNLQGEMGTVVEESIAVIDEALIKQIAALNAAKEGGALTPGQYDAKYQQAMDTAAQERATVTANAAKYLVDTVTQQYADEISQQKENISKILGSEEYQSNDYQGARRFTWTGAGTDTAARDEKWKSIVQDIIENGPSKDTQLALGELVSGMGDVETEVNTLLSDGNGLSEDSRNTLIQIKSDLDIIKSMSAFKTGLFGTPEVDYASVNRAVRNQVKAGGIASYGDIAGYIGSSAGGTDKGLNTFWGWKPGGKTRALEGVDVDHRALGGIIRRPELSTLAENGPEAVIPLDGSARAQALYDMTGRLLGGMGGSPITFSPTIQFYGGAPNRTDIDGALEMSQNRFNDMMNNYLARQRRLAF